MGVSMGIDSVAAFLYLRRGGYNVVPFHYNHNLRHQNDVMQQKFLAFVKHIGCSVYFTNAVDAKPQTHSEAECRQKRFDFFQQCAAAIQSEHLVTAHHLDDCVESYLLNCFRGHPQYKPIQLQSHFDTFCVLHPFALTEKEDFRKFMLQDCNAAYTQYIVYDETNSINKGSRRNWIRNVIVPELTRQHISLKKHCRRQIKLQIQNPEE